MENATRGGGRILVQRIPWASTQNQRVLGDEPDYIPPACAGIFGDVACPSQFADWIEQLAAEGIAEGCGNDNHCPDSSTTRGQMAVFLTRAPSLQ